MKRLAATMILALLTGTAWQVLTADILQAQEESQAPQEVETSPAENSDELTDDEIRELLSKNSVDRFTSHWKRRRGYLNSKTCDDYHRLDGPTVYCESADVPDELVEEYRETQKKLNSTFLTEPTPKF